MSGPILSFEIFPPASEKGDASLWSALDRLSACQPAYVSVTYGAGGSNRDKSEAIVRRLLQETDLVPAAHLTCVGQTRESVDQLAKHWWQLGVRQIVALRGDMPDMEGPYRPHPEGYVNAADLVAGLRHVADFQVSVAAYPESHPDSPSVEADLDNLKRKVDNGATEAITQFFFEAESFVRFRDRATAAGIDVPIVPGILPITNFARTVDFAHKCGATVPAWLVERLDGLDEDPKTRERVAAATAIELCRALMDEAVDTFHIYTLNRAPLSLALCHGLGVPVGAAIGRQWPAVATR